MAESVQGTDLEKIFKYDEPVPKVPQENKTGTGNEELKCKKVVTSQEVSCQKIILGDLITFWNTVGI